MYGKGRLHGQFVAHERLKNLFSCRNLTNGFQKVPTYCPCSWWNINCVGTMWGRVFNWNLLKASHKIRGLSHRSWSLFFYFNCLTKVTLVLNNSTRGWGGCTVCATGRKSPGLAALCCGNIWHLERLCSTFPCLLITQDYCPQWAATRPTFPWL